MTIQERIEQTDKIAQSMCGFCDENKRCVLRDNKPCREVMGQDCGYKESAEMLICAGYGKVSEYKAEIERLRTTLEQCNTELNSALESLKSQCREIGELKAGVKQAKIEVLNEAKKYSYCDNFFPDGKWHRYVFVDDIDKLIEEVENEQKD